MSYAAVDSKKLGAEADYLEKLDSDQSTHNGTIERDSDSDEKDYSGAHEKTDPVEIRLVKKLDLYILPT